MSSESAEKTCNTCQKSEDELPNPLKHCAKCKSQWYCSRECQKADWKKHKSACKGPVVSDNSNSTSSTSASASASTSTSDTSGLPRPKDLSKSLCNISNPFTALKNGTWLHNRPEKDTFKLLVDVYRLRMEDEYKYTGEVDEGSLYSGASRGEALGCLRRFLIKITKRDAKRAQKLLPPWWSPDKLKECLDFALTDEWSDIGCAIEKSDITEHYGSPLMPMQLRMFGEKADGTLTAGMSGEGMLNFQIMAERGNMNGQAVSMLNIAH